MKVKDQSTRSMRALLRNQSKIALKLSLIETNHLSKNKFHNIRHLNRIQICMLNKRLRQPEI